MAQVAGGVVEELRVTVEVTRTVDALAVIVLVMVEALAVVVLAVQKLVQRAGL